MSEVIRELVEEIQQKYKLENPSQVAEEMDFDSSHLRKMMKRNGNPDATNYIKLARKAGWDIDKAYERLEGGYSSISMMILVAIFSAVYFLGITNLAPTHHIASVDVPENVYYVKLKKLIKRMRNAMYSLFRFSYA